MSSSASEQGLRPATALEDSTDDQKNNPPRYVQVELPFEGSYIDDDCAYVSICTNPACPNPSQNESTQNHLNHQCPQNPADLHQLQPNQQPPQYIINHQPDYTANGPPPKYTARQDDANAKPPRYSDTYAPQEKQAIGQQPAYTVSTVHGHPSVAVTYPPPQNWQCIVTQPQVFGGQPAAIIVQPSLEDPPPDYMCFSICVAFCCCWLIGFVAISNSIECRKANQAGDRELAKKKSEAARTSAGASFALGILVYIIVGVVIAIRVTSFTSSV